MGKPLMIQKSDDDKIEHLKKKIGAHTKIDVIRAGLDLLEQEIIREQRILRWKRAAGLVSKSSASINKEFQKHSRLKRS